MTKYVAFTADAIWGMGDTEEAAVAEVVKGVGAPVPDEDIDETWPEPERSINALHKVLEVAEATDALAVLVEEGRASSWGTLRDGRACTEAEQVADERAAALKKAVEAYVATPGTNERRRAELFDAIEQWVYASFEDEEDMTEEKLSQIDVTALAQAYIDRANH
jgi:hypothetical protein